jgi:hypothetical protein
MDQRKQAANALMGYGLLDENPNYRKQIANALMQPSTGDVRNVLTNTVTERASLLPLATYADGTTRLALPEWANSLWEIASLQRRPDPTQGDALLLGGVPALGGLPFAQRGAVGSAGGRLGALPMDEASRMARAREMGFDTDKTWYHGTPYAGFDEFSASPAQRANSGWHGVSFAPDADHASGYSGVGTMQIARNPSIMDRMLGRDPGVDTHVVGGQTGQSAIIPAYLRAQNTYKVTLDELDRIGGDRAALTKRLQRDGYDSMDIMDQGQVQERVIFDPKNIRSPRAAFDPARSDSANLLASNPLTAIAATLLYGRNDSGNP